MNKEQHDKIIKYEQIFRTAIDSNYYRSMDSVFAADFISMCKELNVYINPSCPQCVLRALQTVGKLYFDYKEEPNSQLQIEFPVETPEVKDNKLIKQEKKVNQSNTKQPKKTNKK